MTNVVITELPAEDFLAANPSPTSPEFQLLPDSRKFWEPIPVWESGEPAPLQFVVEDLIPQGYATSLYGDGATGKSYIALIVALHVVLGSPFLGKRVLRGNVLFLDAELDENEFLRRAYRVARGLGLQQLPPGLFYLRLPESLASTQARQKCGDAIASISPALTILDSFNAAAFGVDTNTAADVTALMRGITMWGTTLIIDHIPKTAPGANLSGVRAHGSAFKFNLVRSAISAVRADGGAIALRQTKSNFGPMNMPLYAALAFDVDSVRIESVDVDDARLAGAEDHLTAQEKVLFALRDNGPSGATPQEIADRIETSEKTVRNYLSVLHKQGRAKPVDGRRWRIPVPEGLEAGLGRTTD